MPISDNLAGWLKLLPRKGKVTPNPETAGAATDLAKKLGIPGRHNGLRHSYISYRIAEIKDAAKVALEAGNSPDIIFKHYRELVTEQDAHEWFSIAPASGWSPPESQREQVCSTSIHTEKYRGHDHRLVAKRLAHAIFVAQRRSRNNQVHNPGSS